MFFDDNQRKVDKFICKENPNVPQTPDPRPGKAHIMETVYTRLRNEFGHGSRPGVNLDQTKAEMATRLGDLIALTRRAIELRP
jgi:hypothetical protein